MPLYAAPQPASGEAWVIGDGGSHGETRFRTMKQGMPAWTLDQQEALQFARRQDAELFAEEDEDAWQMLRATAPPTKSKE